MKVAITGASGLLGTALGASLRADGHDVVPVRRPQGGNGFDTSAFDGVDAVVHLAGEPIGAKRWTAAQKRKVLESRSVGTAQVADALARLSTKPRVLLSASGVNYYGDRGDEVLTESSGPGTGFLTDVCLSWEGATRAAVDAGIRTAHLRTSLVLAPKGGALAPMRRLFKLGLGGRLGNGRQWMPWIAIDDHVGAMRFLLDRDIAGPVNLAAPNPVTNAEFTKALAAALHRPAIVPVPKFGPRLLLGRELADALLFTSMRVVPATLEAAGFRFRRPDVGAALAAATSAAS